MPTLGAKCRLTSTLSNQSTLGSTGHGEQALPLRMTDLHFDEEATKGLLALYVTPDIVAQRAQFLSALGPASGCWMSVPARGSWPQQSRRQLVYLAGCPVSTSANHCFLQPEDIALTCLGLNFAKPT